MVTSCPSRTRSGSSPRVRGKPPRLLSLLLGGRLIPARAGKTWGSSGLVYTTKAHPRACGENRACPRIRRPIPGSSPRVRGKHGRRPGGMVLRGLIPARAGKTHMILHLSNALWAHPRACGENWTNAGKELPFEGSSPRVRGKRLRTSDQDGLVRLIPARAGKTRRRRGRGGRRRAHPRACGENVKAVRRIPTLLGSSPRVRGKQHRAVKSRRGRGLIPARAGKTPGARPDRPIQPAHPRACGENARGYTGHKPRTGSSPRVRGKHQAPQLRGQGPGLIPARAGKTRRTLIGYWLPQAHPRACGENTGLAGWGQARAGSSPRVRGKPARRPHRGHRPRLIPARAGKTRRRHHCRGRGGAHPRACGENRVRFAF